MSRLFVMFFGLLKLSLAAFGSGTDFVRGADVSMLKQLDENGAKFYDLNNKKADVLTILKDNGVNWIRIRTWVNPTDEKGKPLGGGNNDTATTLVLVKRAKDMGFKVLLDFHYSDFWADPAKQFKPKDWEGLSGKELEDTLYKYTKDVLQKLKDINATPDMVQIGNELNGGMVWPNGKTWGEGKIGGFDGFAGLLKAGIKAAKEIDSNMQIMIHLAEGGDNKLYRWVFDELTARKVPFDIIGLSYYPYWHGSLEELQHNLNDISKRYDKDVIVVETAYGYTLEDSDGFGNIFGGTEEQKGGYKASVKGQENMIRAIMNVISEVPNNRGKGFFYWEPTWTGIKGAGWKTGEGNGWDNQAMFDKNGKALPSIKAFAANPKEKVEKGKIESINDTFVKTSINEQAEMPNTVTVIYESGLISKEKVKWESIKAKKLEKAGTIEVLGTLEGSKAKAKAIVTIAAQKNFVEDYGFESGDIWKDSKWKLDDKQFALTIDKSPNNVHSETTSLSYWKDADFSFKIYQEITNLPKGKYRLRVWSMGEKGKKEMTLFADNGKGILKTPVSDTSWGNWGKFEIKDIVVEDGKLVIGLEVKASAGNWGKIDDFELVKID